MRSLHPVLFLSLCPALHAQGGCPLQDQLLANPGFESGDLSGWTETAGAGNGNVVAQTAATGCGAIVPGAPRSGGFLFVTSTTDGAQAGTPEISLTQTIDLGTCSAAGAGSLNIVADAYASGAAGCTAGSPSDDTVQLAFEFFMGGAQGTSLGAASTPAIDPLVGAWNHLQLAAGVPAGTDTVVFHVVTRLDPGFSSIDLGVDDVSVHLVGTAANYCSPAVPNSTGQPGVLAAFGSTSASAADLTLRASQLPPGQFGYFLVSRTQGMFTPPGSSGVICLSGNIGRYNSPQDLIQGPSGQVQVDLTPIPVNPPTPVQPGDTLNFQCWYRDVGTSNFTDAVTITYE